MRFSNLKKRFLKKAFDVFMKILTDVPLFPSQFGKLYFNGNFAQLGFLGYKIFEIFVKLFFIVKNGFT